jgi:hypothetical protein
MDTAHDQQAPAPSEQDAPPTAPAPKPDDPPVRIGKRDPIPMSKIAAFCAAGCNVCRSTGYTSPVPSPDTLCGRARLKAAAAYDSAWTDTSAARRLAEHEAEIARLVAELDGRKAAFEEALRATEQAWVAETGAADLDAAIAAAREVVATTDGALAKARAQRAELEAQLEINRTLTENLEALRAENETQAERFEGLRAEKAALLERGRARFERETAHLRRGIQREQRAAALEMAKLGLGGGG